MSVSPVMTRTCSIGTPTPSATIWRMMASVPWPCSVTPVAATTEPSGSMRTVQPSCAEMRAPPMPYMKGLGLVSSMKLAKPMPRWMPLRAQPLLLGAQAGVVDHVEQLVERGSRATRPSNFMPAGEVRG